jgi:hypothetical protein
LLIDLSCQAGGEQGGRAVQLTAELAESPKIPGPDLAAPTAAPPVKVPV